MRKIRDVLRYRHTTDLSLDAIAGALKVSNGVVANDQQELDYFVFDVIRHDLRVLPNQEFTASGKLAKASDLGLRRQDFNFAANFAYDPAGCCRVVFRDVIMNST